MSNNMNINSNSERRIKIIGGSLITIANKGPGALFISDNPNIVSGKTGVMCISPNSIGQFYSSNRGYEFINELGNYEYVSYVYVKTERDKSVEFQYTATNDSYIANSYLNNPESMGLDVVANKDLDGDFRDMILALSKACAEICRNNWVYSQLKKVHYIINDKDYLSRCDCSGMVTAAMMSLGLVNELYTAANFSGGRFKNLLKSYGYTFYNNKNVPKEYWENFPVGTIMANSGHVEVCAGWNNDKVLLYTAGSAPFKINDETIEGAFRQNYNWSEGDFVVAPYEATYGLDYIKSKYTGFYIPTSIKSSDENNETEDNETQDIDYLDIDPDYIVTQQLYIVYPEDYDGVFDIHETTVDEYLGNYNCCTRTINANKLYKSSRWACVPRAPIDSKPGISTLNGEKFFHRYIDYLGHYSADIIYYVDELNAWLMNVGVVCKPTSNKEFYVSPSIAAGINQKVDSDGHWVATIPDDGSINLANSILNINLVNNISFSDGHTITESETTSNTHSPYSLYIYRGMQCTIDSIDDTIQANTNLNTMSSYYSIGRYKNSSTSISTVNVFEPIESNSILLYW